MSKKMNYSFHLNGLASHEQMNMIFDNNDFIVLSDSDVKLTDKEFYDLGIGHEFDDGSEYWVFDKNTGKCINDTAWFGEYRTIPIKKIKLKF